MAPFLDPKNLVENLSLSPDATVADFGAGSGFFVLEAAKKIGPKGKVYAIDILETALEAIQSKAKLYKLSNIETVYGNVEQSGGSHLRDASCDLIFLSNILHQVSDRSALLKETARVLKKEGRAVIIEWLPEKMINPRGLTPIAKEEAKKFILQETPFTFLRELDTDPSHYGLLFQK